MSTDSKTPRLNHVLQHGLAMTGKDELAYLALKLETELDAAYARIAELEAELDNAKKKG